MKTAKIILISSIFLSTILSASASVDRNISFGQSGSEVNKLQDFLTAKGYLNGSTGYFGTLTLRAVKAYQSSIGVSATGFVGIITRQKINSIASSTVSISTDSSSINQNDQSIYDTNTKVDKDGRVVNITQVPNYKFLNVVGASLGGVNGFFYKDTKTFLSNFDLKTQQEATQAQVDALNGKNIVTTPTQPLNQNPILIVSQGVGTFSRSNGDIPRVSFLIQNTSSTTVIISSIGYEASINGLNSAYGGGTVSVSVNGAPEEVSTIGNSFTFSNPIYVQSKGQVQLSVSFRAKISTLEAGKLLPNLPSTQLLPMEI
jgi:peptidoglycan hydrolase-like protein with peptidoglycan-binding domain